MILQYSIKRPIIYALPKSVITCIIPESQNRASTKPNNVNGAGLSGILKEKITPRRYTIPNDKIKSKKDVAAAPAILSHARQKAF
jgi:hypothetical protein